MADSAKALATVQRSPDMKCQEGDNTVSEASTDLSFALTELTDAFEPEPDRLDGDRCYIHVHSSHPAGPSRPSGSSQTGSQSIMLPAFSCCNLSQYLELEPQLNPCRVQPVQRAWCLHVRVSSDTASQCLCFAIAACSTFKCTGRHASYQKQQENQQNAAPLLT